jgi:hypothetical protein
MRKLFVAAATVAIFALLVSPAIGASGGNGKGKGGGQQVVAGSDITLNESDPHLGGTVTFTVTISGHVRDPRVQVVCKQGDEMVYGEAGWVTDSFTLGGWGSLWTQRGGSADCVADLYYWDTDPSGMQTFVGLDSTSFTASG